MSLRNVVRALGCLALFTAVPFGAACGVEEDGAEGATGEALGAAAASLAISAVAAPQPVPATDRQQHLVYELLFVNLGATAARIDRLDVLEPGRRAPLASYQGEALDGILVTSGNDTVGPGEAGLAFVHVALPIDRSPPRQLAHRIGIVRDGRAVVVSDPTVAVSADPVPHLGPPLRGGSLLDVNGCCTGAHTRGLFAFPDGLFVAQRYAVDFQRVDVARARAGENPFFAGDATRNESYFTFGAEVMAVTPGRIVAVRDGVPENTPTLPLPPLDDDALTGNYVVEALDGGRFALYAHLHTGSVRVRPGDRVGCGQVLGLVGNTGNSDSPHLHFHVMDRPSPLDGNGLAFVFDRLRLEHTVDLDADAPPIVDVPAPQERRGLLPMMGDIVGFP